MVIFLAFEVTAIAVVALACFAYWAGAKRTGAEAGLQTAHVLFGSGMATMALALLPPVTIMAGHLYWVLQLQTLALRMVAPMLIMLAAARDTLVAGLPERWHKLFPVQEDDPFFMDEEPARGASAVVRNPAVVTLLFIGVFVFWQTPACLDGAVLHPALAAARAGLWHAARHAADGDARPDRAWRLPHRQDHRAVSRLRRRRPPVPY